MEIPIDSRWDILYRLIKENEFTNYVEVGVYYGANAIRLFDKCKVRNLLNKMYLIDLVSYPQITKFVQDNIGVVNFLQMGGYDAARLFDDNSLDMVFIDANHDYNCVKLDIETWWKKVKVGGILSGHDFSDAEPGVVKAVTELIGNYNIEQDGDMKEAKVSVWWIKKRSSDEPLRSSS